MVKPPVENVAENIVGKCDFCPPLPRKKWEWSATEEEQDLFEAWHHNPIAILFSDGYFETPPLRVAFGVRRCRCTKRRFYTACVRLSGGTCIWSGGRQTDDQSIDPGRGRAGGCCVGDRRWCGTTWNDCLPWLSAGRLPSFDPHPATSCSGNEGFRANIAEAALCMQRTFQISPCYCTFVVQIEQSIRCMCLCDNYWTKWPLTYGYSAW